MKTNLRSALLDTDACGALMMLAASSRAADDCQIFVSNEKAGTLTVINGADFKVTVPSLSANARAASTPAQTAKPSMSP